MSLWMPDLQQIINGETIVRAARDARTRTLSVSCLNLLQNTRKICLIIIIEKIRNGKESLWIGHR